MGAARKLWQAAKTRCPAWDRDSGKKDDLGPTLDKLEDAFADLSKSAAKIKGGCMKARELVGEASNVGARYRRSIDFAPGSLKLYFQEGVGRAVDQLSTRHAVLVHQRLTQAQRDLQEMKAHLNGLR